MLSSVLMAELKKRGKIMSIFNFIKHITHQTQDENIDFLYSTDQGKKEPKKEIAELKKEIVELKIELIKQEYINNYGNFSWK